MIKRRIELPVGLSGIFDYSHIKIGRYDVRMKEGYQCYVEIIRADRDGLVYDVYVSENLSEALKCDVSMLSVLERCGAIDRRVVYRKG